MMTDQKGDLAVQKVLEHRRFVLKEFVDSEREYVERLRVTVEDYLSHIRAGGPDVPPTLKMDILSIFSTLPEIYEFHHKVLFPALQEHDWEDAEGMVGAFLKHGSEFTTKYVAYCKNKPVSDSTRVEYEDFFSARQTELGQKLSIEDLLIAPVQRLPRYQLLIRDLLKDTRKVNMDTAKIEEALELMQRIPKETNNTIAMSLLKGLPRGNVLSHGSLWRQESLLFSTNGTKEEALQVYLFDHRIIVATPADSEGFYHYKISMKTLEGKISAGGGEEFEFTDEGGTTYRFRADKKDSAENWIKDLQSILTSQQQMKKALIFGKPATSPVVSRTQSIGMEWSDSNSSVDSMPSSDSDIEDWPQETGFMSLDAKRVSLTITKVKEPKKRKRGKSMPTPFFPKSMDSSPQSNRAQSFHAPAADIEQTVLRKSESLSLSPGIIKKWLTNHKEDITPGYVHYPHSNHCFVPPRSPGAFRKVSQSVVLPPEELYYIAIDNQPDVAEQVYKPPPGQMFQPVDVSRGDVWRVEVLSGDNAGEEVWVQRNMIEEYIAPIVHRTVKKLYSFINDLGRGRFSEVRLARRKSNKKLVAVKLLKEGTTEETFFRELCITSRLKHSNLISCQCGLQNGGMALVLDNINGRTLFDYLIRRSSVTETMVIDLIEQLLDALHYLHSHTIVHMDLRPSNIMIQITRSTDLVRVIDFGAARHYGSPVLTQQFEPMLEYQYAAPEIFQQDSIGPGTDMWSLGVIIYTIFHGCGPFHGGSNLHTIANITAARYFVPTRHNPACSSKAVDLLKDIFVLSMRNRPSAEAAKSYDWFKMADSFKQNKVDIFQLKQFVRNQHSS